MELNFDTSLIEGYYSGTQIARILTESWVEKQMFCPHCGNPRLSHFLNNQPVADFYCPSCHAEYELKSKNGRFGKKVADGSYQTMIERISSNDNPDFLFMGYSKKDLCVNDFFFVPRFFFVPSVIERRPPLSSKARRAGWTGCNILLTQIPEQGRISIVADGIVMDQNIVTGQVQKSSLLKMDNITSRGWLIDVLNCVNQIPGQEFSLNDVYGFEDKLSEKHSQNHNIRPKIRQQLQILRDKGFLTFLGNGTYQKCIWQDK